MPSKRPTPTPISRNSQDAVSMNIEKRCNHYTLIMACMLSGASQDRPVIVGWSTAPRGQVIQENLGQVPKKLAAGPRVLARTESSRTQSGTRPGGPPHDHWAKLGQLRYTRSQYAFVVMHFSRWNSSRRPREKTILIASSPPASVTRPKSSYSSRGRARAILRIPMAFLPPLPRRRSLNPGRVDVPAPE